jgi:hypothetical protein
MDAFAVAGGALVIFLGAIFNFIFGLISALALAFGRGVDFAFGGAFVVFFSFFFSGVFFPNNFGSIIAFALAFGGGVDFTFQGAFVVFFSFFVADVVVVFPNNLKLGGNCIIPSLYNNFKLGRVNFGLPLPCAIIFFDVAFA